MRMRIAGRSEGMGAKPRGCRARRWFLMAGSSQRAGLRPTYCKRRLYKRSGHKGILAPPLRCAKAGEAEVCHYLAQNGEFVLWVVEGRGLVERARGLHSPISPTATQALGRVLLGTLLIGESKETMETVQVTFKGNGPLGQVMAIAEKGHVKGRMNAYTVESDLVNPGGNGTVGDAVGRQGVVTVVRKNESLQQYTGNQQMGITELVNGEVAEDLTNYLAESEQINSALGLGLVLASDLTVSSAGGYLLQMLPGATEDTVEKLEQSVSSCPPVSEMMEARMTQREVAESLCGDLGLELVFQKTLGYGPCNTTNLSERMAGALKLMPVTEIRSILEEQGMVEMECEFCREKVVFTEEDLVARGVIGEL